MTIESNIKYLSIYDNYFGPSKNWSKESASETIVQINPSRNWEEFEKIKSNVDFSMGKIVSTSEKIYNILVNIILFPYGIYNLLKFSIQRLIMLRVFPIQNLVLKTLFYGDQDKLLASKKDDLNKDGFLVKEVFLENKGIRIQGLLVGSKDTINNGKWVLQTTGNCEPIESTVDFYSRLYNKKEANVLLINLPGVSKSEGYASAETMGDAVDVGIHFLETAVRANNIILAGRSLGSAAISAGILKHNFKMNCKYTVLRQMTFDSLSNLCAKITGYEKFVKLMIKWTNLEIDSIEASRFLQNQKIPEVIVQAGNEGYISDDGVIPAYASLAHGLKKANLTEEKEFKLLEAPLGSKVHDDFINSIELSAEKI